MVDAVRAALVTLRTLGAEPSKVSVEVSWEHPKRSEGADPQGLAKPEAPKAGASELPAFGLGKRAREGWRRFVLARLDEVAAAVNSHVAPASGGAAVELHHRVADLVDACDAWAVVGNEAAVRGAQTHAQADLVHLYEEACDELEGARAVLRELRADVDSDVPLSVLAQLVADDLRAESSGREFERREAAQQGKALESARKLLSAESEHVERAEFELGTLRRQLADAREAAAEYQARNAEVRGTAAAQGSLLGECMAWFRARAVDSSEANAMLHRLAAAGVRQ